MGNKNALIGIGVLILVAGLAFYFFLSSSAPDPEDQLVIYSTIDPEDFEYLRQAFNSKYPDVEITYVQDRPGNIYTRIVTEKDAGQTTSDVVIITLPLQMSLQDEGLLELYRSPENGAYPDVFKDPNGFWVATSLLPVVQVYNTDLISSEEIPKTIDELIDPKWKGTTLTHDITLGTTGTNWLGSFKTVLGEEQFTKLIEGLAYNVQPVRERSFSGTPRMVGQGEYGIGLTAYMHDLISNKANGAPLEMFQVEELPIGTTLLPVSLVSEARHPIAAKLFIDFILSEEGQTVLGNIEVRIAARPGITATYTLETVLPGKTPEDLLIFPNDDARQNLESFIELFTELFGG